MGHSDCDVHRVCYWSLLGAISVAVDMSWFRRRRKIDASDMQIVEITGAISSPPKIVGSIFVPPPTFPKGTVTVVENVSGVLVVEDTDE